MLNRDTFFPAGTVFTQDDEREFAREELIYNLTQDLLVFMEDRDISKAKLAQSLGKTKAYVTQVLNGSRNMTLSTLSDICFAIGAQISMELQECAKQEEGYHEEIEIMNSSDNYSHMLSDSLLFRNENSSWEELNVLEAA